MRRYAVIIERGRRNLSAWVPDLLGCVSVGRTLPEMRRMIREAIEGHIEVMQDYGDPIPPPTSTCASVEAGRRYSVLVERTPRGFTARAPDLEGCVAAAKTRREALLLLRDTLPRHIENLRWDGKPAPAPACLGEMVEVRPGPPRKHAPWTVRGETCLPRTGGRNGPRAPRHRVRRPSPRRRGGLPVRA